jgi:hypothetical protein
MEITYTLSAHDDGYRVRDWFRGAQHTLDAAEEATTAEEAERVLHLAYKGPDVDGVTVSWQISE